MNSVKMRIGCKQCNGHYVIREGTYGVFGGCSNYPKCKSTIKLYEFVQELLRIQGVNIYKWDKACWKCNKVTPVYSYYLSKQLANLEGFPADCFGTIGLGDILSIDELLEKDIPTIRKRYSKTVGYSYTANSCVHCGAIQGRNYVVDDPHEILHELWYGGMEKYFFKTIKPEINAAITKDLKEIFATS